MSLRITLIDTRNKLLHSSRDLDIDLLDKETTRLQAIVERFLLRMLGWTDFSALPSKHLRKWLIES